MRQASLSQMLYEWSLEAQVTFFRAIVVVANCSVPERLTKFRIFSTMLGSSKCEVRDAGPAMRPLGRVCLMPLQVTVLLHWGWKGLPADLRRGGEAAQREGPARRITSVSGALALGQVERC